ncbi:hypothetical protein D3C87_1478430 [compost metagenome]
MELGNITRLVDEVAHHILMQFVDAEGLGEAAHLTAKTRQRLGICTLGGAEGIRAHPVPQQVEVHGLDPLVPVASAIQDGPAHIARVEEHADPLALPTVLQ